MRDEVKCASEDGMAFHMSVLMWWVAGSGWGVVFAWAYGVIPGCWLEVV